MSEKTSSNIDFNKYTIPQLKTILKDNGLPVSGTKPNLVNRLEDSKISPSKMNESISNLGPKISNNKTRKANKYSPEDKDSVEELLATLNEENDNKSSLADEKESPSADKKDTTLTVDLNVEPISSSCGLSADGSTSKKEKSSSERKNTDNNAFELVVALMPFYHNKTVSELISLDHSEISQYVNVPATEYANYMNDLKTRNPNTVKKYMDTLRRKVQSEFPDETITRTDLEGKNLKTNELKDLNTGKDKKEAKADVYFHLKKGETKRIIGMSVKQTKDCTKTNFSVEKMIFEITNDKQIRENLSELRKKVIIDAGLQGEAKQLNIKRPDLTKKELKTLKDKIRAKLNSLFSPKLNPGNLYWIALKRAVDERVQELAEKIVKNLFPSDLGYPLYEFDGIDFERLDVPKDTKITMKSSARYATKKSGDDRDAAKLFYQLKVDSKKYRIEIRFKGDIWASSPQFLTHETNSPTSASGGGKTRKLRKT